MTLGESLIYEFQPVEERRAELDSKLPLIRPVSDALLKYHQVTELCLSGRQMTSVPDNLLTPNLKRLDISDNLLSSLPDGLRLCSNLEEVDFSRNLICDLNQDIQIAIKHLDLSWNLLQFNLNELTVWLGQLFSCSRLNLSGNPVSNPVKFKDMKFGRKNRRLKYLKMGNCHLSSFPEEFTSLLDLRHLVLSNKPHNYMNSIMKLPTSINNLVDLVSLELAGLGLVELPEALGLLSNLKILDVSRNNIFSLPVTLSKLTSLRILNASCNELHFLSHPVEQMSSLEHLLVSRNKLGELPLTLPKLATLDAYSNQISKVPSKLLMGNVTRCDLAGNLIALDMLEEMVGEHLVLKYKKMQNLLRTWNGLYEEDYRLNRDLFSDREDMNETVVEEPDIEDYKGLKDYNYMLGSWQEEEFNVFGPDIVSDDIESTLSVCCNPETDDLEDVEDSSSDWEQYNHKKQPEYKYDLERMDRVQYWGKEQFCPADRHPPSMKSLVYNKMQKERQLASLHLGTYMEQRSSRTQRMEQKIIGQFDDLE